MNKQMILSWLLQEAERRETSYRPKYNTLEEALHELANRRENPLPASIPRQSGEAVPLLREHFRDNVTFVSLVLNDRFPEEYLFYRVSQLEGEILEGLDFFAEIVPEFELEFPRIGRRGFARYEKLNRALLSFAHDQWPDLKEPQARMAAFLYDGLGRLFLTKSDYNRYWISASRPEHWWELDKETVDKWSGCKEMKVDDLVFIYRTAPRKAITDIYRVVARPGSRKWPFAGLLGASKRGSEREPGIQFDIWGAWNGFWVTLRRVCRLEDIPFALMRTDPVLSQWGTVRKQFTGTITEPVPHSVYNRLLELVPEALRVEHGLEEEPVEPGMGSSGGFSSEAEFEEEVVIPLLKRWRFRFERQHLCRFRIGSQNHPCRVDFLVKDERGPLTLFEDKFRIRNENQLTPAVEQAKSYALMLGLPSFVVAAPEGIWLYSLERNVEELRFEVPGDGLAEQEEELRRMIVRFRK